MGFTVKIGNKRHGLPKPVNRRHNEKGAVDADLHERIMNADSNERLKKDIQKQIACP